MIICIGPSGSLRGAPRDEALSRAKRGNPWDCHALRARHDIFWSVEMVPISYSAIIYTQFPDFLEVKVPGLADKKIAFPWEGYFSSKPKLDRRRTERPKKIKPYSSHPDYFLYNPIFLAIPRAVSYSSAASFFCSAGGL